MQSFSAKKILKNQPFSAKKTLKNQQSSRNRTRTTIPKTERVQYIQGLFSPPKPKTNDPQPAQKEVEEWRNLSTLGLLITFAVIMVLISLVGDYGLFATAKLNNKEEQLLTMLQRMEVEEENLLNTIHALHYSSGYLEALARVELGLAKTDEILYYLPRSLRLPTKRERFSNREFF